MGKNKEVEDWLMIGSPDKKVNQEQKAEPEEQDDEDKWMFRTFSKKKQNVA